MTGWVIDASMALAWVFPDERSDEADRFFEHVAPGDARWVPSLWWLEVTNALLSARRRGRLTEAEAVRAIQIFGELQLETDALTGAEGAWRLHVLAKRYVLSAYDAAYLELAQRKTLGLATLDEKLSEAARQSGLPVFPPGAMAGET